MQIIERQTGAPGARSWTRRAAVGIAALAGLSSLTFGLSVAGASAQTVAAPTGASAKVVRIVTRGSFGKILAAKSSNLSLYEHPSGPCTGGCLSVWPPLLMPKGDTKPEGAKGLGTVKFTGGRLQVTYNKQPLYTFVDDKGKSVNGNGVGGFVVAEYTG
jgi:predicted lipoprotein with Yx(FWY)xxD motif